MTPAHGRPEAGGPLFADNIDSAPTTDIEQTPGDTKPASQTCQTQAVSDDAVVQTPTVTRWIILFTVCWSAVPMLFSTSAALGVAPEIAATFGVDDTVISSANAGVFFAMAASPLIWIPLGRVLGRRIAYLVAGCLILISGIGTAVAQSIAVYTALWVIGGSTGVVFLVSGQTIIADIFEPTRRGTAVGCFLGTTVATNAIAPLLGGVITTYTSWRVIYYLQTGMMCLGIVLAWFFVPKDVVPRMDLGFRTDKPTSQCLMDLVKAFSPVPVFKVMGFPNILLADIACGLLSFNQYGLLSAIRYSINTRFNLTTPLTSGLFFLAPGGGFLFGSTLGGRISDHTVKKWIKKRNGLRLPRDRLRSGLGAMFIVLPVGTLLYGWGLSEEFGGMPLPAISCFVAGVGLMWAFSGLNTYSAEVYPAWKTESISSKYLVQYACGGATIASRIPMMENIGIGWSFTITALTGFCAGFIVLFLIRYEPETEKLAARAREEKQ